MAKRSYTSSIAIFFLIIFSRIEKIDFDLPLILKNIDSDFSLSDIFRAKFRIYKF